MKNYNKPLAENVESYLACHIYGRSRLPYELGWCVSDMLRALGQNPDSRTSLHADCVAHFADIIFEHVTGGGPADELESITPAGSGL